MIYIIGAGPAGISLAYYSFLAGEKDIYIFEKANFTGGLSRSWKHNNFILDTGPHIFHTDDNEIAQDWKNIGEDLLIKGEYNSCNILEGFSNKLFHYPLSIQTIKDNTSEYEYLQILNQIEALDPNDNSRSATNFKDFMMAKVGRTLTEMFYTDYPQKVWGISTSEMLADWAPQRIELRKKNSPFYTKPFVAVGKYGTGCFYDRILEKMSKSKKLNLNLNKELTNIQYKDNIIRKLIFNKNEEIDVSSEDHVFSTIPATSLAKILEIKLNLKFRGVRSQYFFFKNPRIIPKNYNWVYCSDRNLSFNRITEPSTMTKSVCPKDYSFICVETTFPGDQKSKLDKSYNEFSNWIKNKSEFNTDGYMPELNTENYERYVYPIQDSKYRSSLAIYNSKISTLKNLSVIGTGGEFHYSDMQIIFRKSKTLINSYLNKHKNKDRVDSIPLISSFKKIKNKSIETKHIFEKKSQFKVKKLHSYLHQISGVEIPLIAEIGINHNGDIKLAKEMMLAAKKSGAHFAKFQYYKENSRVEKNKLTEYLHETADGTEMSLNDVFERSRINFNECIELIEYGNKINFPTFFTVFDEESAIDINKLNQKIIKVASMDCNNLILHKKINSLNFKTIIISTGMSDIAEVKKTLSTYDEDKEILFMSCRSSYPARFEDIDFGEIEFLKNETNCFVGYSDHTEGTLASLISVASGASFIERHFTTNKFLPGPDNRMSIDEKETLELTNKLQLVSNSIKRKQKIIHPSEQITFSMQKKSLRFPSSKFKGDIIHTDDMISIAPPEGYSLFQVNLPRTFLKVKKDVKKGDPISESNVEIIDC